MTYYELSVTHYKYMDKRSEDRVKNALLNKNNSTIEDIENEIELQGRCTPIVRRRYATEIFNYFKSGNEIQVSKSIPKGKYTGRFSKHPDCNLKLMKTLRYSCDSVFGNNPSESVCSFQNIIQRNMNTTSAYEVISVNLYIHELAYALRFRTEYVERTKTGYEFKESFITSGTVKWKLKSNNEVGQTGDMTTTKEKLILKYLSENMSGFLDYETLSNALQEYYTLSRITKDIKDLDSDKEKNEIRLIQVPQTSNDRFKYLKDEDEIGILSYINATTAQDGILKQLDKKNVINRIFNLNPLRRNRYAVEITNWYNSINHYLREKQITVLERGPYTTNVSSDPKYKLKLLDNIVYTCKMPEKSNDDPYIAQCNKASKIHGKATMYEVIPSLLYLEELAFVLKDETSIVERIKVGYRGYIYKFICNDDEFSCIYEQTKQGQEGMTRDNETSILLNLYNKGITGYPKINEIYKRVEVAAEKERVAKEKERERQNPQRSHSSHRIG